MDRDGALDKLKIIFMVNLNIGNYHLKPIVAYLIPIAKSVVSLL